MTVGARNRAVHFVGVSDVLEPNPAWRKFKRELTGQQWDYDFRRLFYTWTPDELESILGEERGATFGRVYDVSDAGNFEGRNILHAPRPLVVTAKELGMAEGEARQLLAGARETLYGVRSRRPPPPWP